MAAENDNQEQAQPKFTIEGKQYELPVLIDNDMDEWMIAYKYAKVTITDTVPKEDPVEEAARVEKLSQPGVWMALFHIAYRRAHPKKTEAAIEVAVGKISYLEVLVEIADQLPDEDGEDENPTSATEPETSSERSSESSPESLSLVSLPSSETPAVLPAATGISG